MRVNQLILRGAFLFLSISAYSPTPSIQSIAAPVPTELLTATPTPQSTPMPLSTAIPSPTVTLTPTVSLAINPYGTVSLIPSPDGRWTAVLDTRVGSLDLQRADGEKFGVFAPGSTADNVSWSPDSRRLLVVRTNWLPPQPDVGVTASAPIQIWQIRIQENQPEQPVFLFEPQPDPQMNPGGAAQIDFGHWSPNSRYVLFWLGPLSASIQADGVSLFMLDVETGKTTQLANDALLNPRYQSWSPDSSALVFTAGGYRSAQINKWLDLFDVATGQVTTIISQTEAIPGIVAWSPRGDWIAYAAVLASETNDNLADWMSFENTAILKRRVYLLNPKTHEHHRLNQVDAFQDAPVWSDDGAVLYYVQRDGNDMVLMTANPTTGQAQIIEGSRRPAPVGVGYYGQSNWDDLLAYRFATSAPPSPTHAPTSPTPTATAMGQPAAWKKIIGKYVTFEYPPSWDPSPTPLGGGATLEMWHLGIPNGGPDQDLGFSAVSSQEARPNDIILEKTITLGGKPGFEWIRSGPNYVSYDYVTTGPNNQGNFSVHVTVAQQDAALEALLDQLVQSIVFNSLTEGPIYQIVWSPDSKIIAAVSQRGICLYDHATLALIQTIDEGEYTESVAFSPDGTRLACTCGEGLIKIWDVKSGQLLKTLTETDDKFFTSVAFNPNGTQIAGGNYDGGVKVWDATGDKLLFTLEGLYVNVYPLMFSPDGKRILAGSSLSGAVKVWDASTGQLLHTFPEDSGFFGVEFSPDGTRMATSNIGGEVIKVWDVNSGQLLTALTQIEVVRFALSPDGKQVICACNGGIWVWDVDSGKQIGTLSSNDLSVYSIALSPDGKQLAVGTRNGFVKILSMTGSPSPNPLVRKNALGGFPFPAGTTWVYSRVQYEQVIGDPTQIMTTTNLITETVVRAEGTVPSQEFLHKETASLVSAPSGWQDNSSNFNWESWYRIVGTQIFSSPEGYRQINILVYDFPFAVGKSWCPEVPPPAYNPTCSSMGRRTVENQTSYATPIGSFDECYEISQDINSGGVTEWFCNGIGVVARKYDHSGSRFGFQDTLIGFSLGSSPP